MALLCTSGSGRGGRRNGLKAVGQVARAAQRSVLLRAHASFSGALLQASPVDAEGTATALLAVIKTLASWPDVLEILDDVEKTYNKHGGSLCSQADKCRATAAHPKYDAFLPTSSPRSWTGFSEVPATSSMEPITSRLSDIIMLNSITACWAGAATATSTDGSQTVDVSVDQEGQALIILALGASRPEHVGCRTVSSAPIEGTKATEAAFSV